MTPCLALVGRYALPIGMLFGVALALGCTKRGPPPVGMEAYVYTDLCEDLVVDEDAGVPEDSPAWCWKALPPITDTEDFGNPWNVTLVPGRHGDLWMTYDGLVHVRGFLHGVWQDIPRSANDWGGPALALDTQERPVLAFRGEDDDAHASVVVVERWDGSAYTPIGSPFARSAKQGNSIEDPVLVIDHAGRPIVFWQESGRGLYAMRWSGAAWQPLGGKLEDSDSLGMDSPSVALDADGTPWVAWLQRKARGNTVRVTRWDEHSWSDVGGTANGNLRCAVAAYQPRLVLGAGGPFVLWTKKQPHESSHIARWDGHDWHSIPSPAYAWLPHAVVADDGSLVLAWRAPAEGLGGHDSVTVERLTTTGWRTVVRGLRFDGDGANVAGVGLAVRPAGGLYVAWTDSAAHTRVVEVNRCKPGERPGGSEMAR